MQIPTINLDEHSRLQGHPANSGEGRTTAKFAKDNLVEPQTVRKRYSATGSYFGIVPEKLANGKLKWPT